MIIPKFRKSSEPSITYDWVDIAEGTGLIQFDGLHTYDSTGINSTLVRSSTSSNYKSIAYYSSDNPYTLITATGNIATTAYTKVLDKDFDLVEFKKTMIVKGKVYLRFSAHWFISSAGNNSEAVFKVVGKLRKWDGATETEICSVTSNDSEEYGVGESKEKDYSLIMESPQTLFKGGEQLRLTIEVYVKSDTVAGDNTYYVNISGDPQDAASSIGNYSVSAGHSRIILVVPFKMNI